MYFVTIALVLKYITILIWVRRAEFETILYFCTFWQWSMYVWVYICKCIINKFIGFPSVHSVFTTRVARLNWNYDTKRASAPPKSTLQINTRRQPSVSERAKERTKQKQGMHVHTYIPACICAFMHGCCCRLFCRTFCTAIGNCNLANLLSSKKIWPIIFLLNMRRQTAAT